MPGCCTPAECSYRTGGTAGHHHVQKDMQMCRGPPACTCPAELPTVNNASVNATRTTIACVHACSGPVALSPAFANQVHADAGPEADPKEDQQRQPDAVCGTMYTLLSSLLGGGGAGGRRWASRPCAPGQPRLWRWGFLLAHRAQGLAARRLLHARAAGLEALLAVAVSFVPAF